MFFAPARFRVVKITCSSSKAVLRTMKYTVIYPGSGPSLELISLRPMAWYRRCTCVTSGEQRAQEVHMVKGDWILSPYLKGRGLL
jgi:hypothetical protein